MNNYTDDMWKAVKFYKNSSPTSYNSTRVRIDELFETNVMKAVGIKYKLVTIQALNGNGFSICLANSTSYKAAHTTINIHTSQLLATSIQQPFH